MYNLYDNGDYLLGCCRDVKRITKNYIDDYINEDNINEYKEMLKDLEENYRDTDVILISYNDYYGCCIQSTFKDKDVIK